MKSLAIAYGARKQSKGKRMPVGEMTDKMKIDPEDMPQESKLSMIDAIRAKMNKGGMCMSKGGMVDEDEDFLSMDDGGEDIDWNEHPIPPEAGEIEGEGNARKMLLAKILSKRLKG